MTLNCHPFLFMPIERSNLTYKAFLLSEDTFIYISNQLFAIFYCYFYIKNLLLKCNQLYY